MDNVPKHNKNFFIFWDIYLQYRITSTESTAALGLSSLVLRIPREPLIFSVIQMKKFCHVE